MAPGHLQGGGKILAPPADQPREHIQIECQHPWVFVGIAAGQSRLADARGAIEVDQSWHGATIRAGPETVGRFHGARSADALAGEREWIDHRSTLCTCQVASSDASLRRE